MSKLFDIDLKKLFTLSQGEKNLLIELSADMFIQEALIEISKSSQDEQKVFWSQFIFSLDMKLEQYKKLEKYEECYFFNEIKWRIIDKLEKIK